MNATSENRGFTFPGTFEVTAFGPATPELESTVVAEIKALGVTVIDASRRTRPSREGKFLAVSVSFLCDTRERYEAILNRLRTHPAVKWIL
jgi:putative lipoic acid-binding regulatory protein